MPKSHTTKVSGGAGIPMPGSEPFPTASLNPHFQSEYLTSEKQLVVPLCAEGFTFS